LAEIILNGPDPEADGISAYTLEDLAAQPRRSMPHLCSYWGLSGSRAQGMNILRPLPKTFRDFFRILSAILAIILLDKLLQKQTVAPLF